MLLVNHSYTRYDESNNIHELLKKSVTNREGARMNAEANGLWWMVVLAGGSVGTAIVAYAVRQQEPLPLVFGIVIGLVPLFVGSGWGAAVLSMALGGLFVVLWKRR